MYIRFHLIGPPVYLNQISIVSLAKIVTHPTGTTDYVGGQQYTIQNLKKCSADYNANKTALIIVLRLEPPNICDSNYSNIE